MRRPSCLLLLGLALAACPRERAPVGPVPEAFVLTPAQASAFAGLSLDCTERPFPNKPERVYDRADEIRPPVEETPAFFGCFDWHSAVHGHWALVRLLRRFPDLPEAAAIRARLDAHLTPERLERELAFFRLERNALFERPYGWAWYLRLAAEAASFDDPDARRWAAALRPLAGFLAERSRAYLDKLSAPIRSGVHPNTAFALAHMLDAARQLGLGPLEADIARRARDFYLADRDCPTAYEPSGEDFLSPCLAEADLMRRLLGPTELSAWLDGFLPPPSDPRFAPLAHPIEVRDRHDPKIGHLIGLAFHRAWCLEGLAAALPAGDPRVAAYARAAAVQRRAGLEQMFDSGYGGSHWLASFAIYLTTGAGR